ncbi:MULTISPECIES: hypothetical protein [unclassified Streptomyces]|uniref:hypothetical protein n=1 Tax=unclassified Streptomyces TaxID=2593676 RepID=UPI0020360579|nr:MULTISPECIES: hypothetical protein [unclassified Streptomyces]
MNRPATPSSATEPTPPDTGPDSGAGPDGVVRRPARAAWIRLAFLVVLLVALGAWVALGGGDLLREVRQWVDSLGMWGRSSSRSATPWP